MSFNFDYRRLRWPVAVLAAGALGTVLAMVQQGRDNDAALLEAARHAVKEASWRIDLRLQRYEYGVLGARGVIVAAGVDKVDAALFARYSKSRDYAVEFPGARGFGFIRRVSQEDEAAYVARMQRTYGSGFSIIQLQPHVGERDVIELIEPLEPNRRAVGLDIASEPDRRRAAASASSTGRATLTAPITLLQASGKVQQSFLLLLPVYADGNTRTPANVAGWTYAPLVMGEVLASMTGELADGRLILEDVSTPDQPRRFHDAGVSASGAPTVTHSSIVLGRRWRISFRPSPAFVAHRQLLAPGLLGGVGALLTVLCAALATAAQAYRVRQVRLRTTQAHLAAIVESSTDAIIGSSLDGIVTSWNRGAEQLFGYSAGEAMGHAVAELIVPLELRHEERAILAAVRCDKPFEILLTQRRRRDGGVLEVSMSVAPIRDGSGAVVGGSKTIRDISALVAAQAAIGTLNASLERDVALRTEELDAARRSLRTVLDAVPAMIGYWDSSMVNRVANRAYADFFGIAPDAIPGRSMRALLGDALFKEVEPYALAALQGEAQQFERSLTPRVGGVRHTLAHYVPDVVDGVTSGFYVIAHDVSDLVASRQALASALREKDVLVRTINEQMLYSVTDTSGVIIEVNDNFCHALGYRRDQLIGADHRLLKTGEHDRGFWARMWQTIGEGHTWHGTICNCSSQGEPRWFDTVIAPYFNEHKRIERYVALRTDVTDRHAADAALSRLSALLGNVLRAASEMSLVATDTSGMITLFNAGAERMLGYTQNELVGRMSPERLHDPEEVGARARELSALSGRLVSGFEAFVYVPLLDGAETREWTYVRKDGGRIPVSLTVTAMRDDSGLVLGFLGVAIDISQRKRDEAALRLSMQLVEQASQAKGAFLANMSHEIRTPMNAVLGMLTLARRTTLSERQRDYLDKAAIAGNSLLGLLNDILDFSKIEAGKLELDILPFLLEDLLHELAVVLTGNNSARAVDVMFDVAPNVPTHLTGDRRRLLQVLINLAGNALKFTHQGNVVVNLSVLRRTADAVTLRIGVSDSGIGIAADQLRRIFDGFTQAEASTARRFGGTGLGLAISARLVALMGSKLQVESKSGKGSSFWFDLTLDHARDEAVDADPALNGLRVLVVDDSEISGAILVRMAQALGCHARRVSDGHAALDLVAEADAHAAPFGAVLMDLHMPGLDGLQTAAALVRRIRKPPPVIIVSAHNQDELREGAETAAAPYRAVLVQPVTSGALGAALQRILTPVAMPAAAPPSVLPLSLDGMRLLIVEDNHLNRQVAFELLVGEGARVDLADSGLAAVSMATGGGQHYDVILMDVQMPGMDGLEATRRIRRHESGAHTIIVAMTANASTADRKDCIEAGMDAHIGKPFDIDEVAFTLRQLTGLVERELRPGEKRSHEPGPPIDLQGALRRFQGKVDAYRRALADFAFDAPRMLDQLQQQADVSYKTEKSAALHALKGIALTLGANGLAAAFAQADTALASATLVGEVPEVPDFAALARQTASTIEQIQLLLAFEDDASLRDVDVISHAAQLSAAQRAEKMAILLPLLDSGNLRAVDVMEELATRQYAEPNFLRALDAVRQLRFADAALLLRQ